jgi:16S rRNA G1207 methylase RsmC
MFAQEIVNHSNLFSREKLDIGTRFLLEHIPKGDFETILDLGCANGIVGIMAKKMNPQAKLIFSDESQMAIQSARINYQQYYSDEAEYHWTNCYENQAKNSLDLVLCNPPFHQSNTIGDFIAWQMFQDARDALKTGAVLRVIGNSHLGYQIKLKKLFGNSKMVATNSKFMIVDAVK